MNRPEWFEAGSPVDDVAARSEDADYFIDSEFFEEMGLLAEDEDICDPNILEWRLCDVPIVAFGPMADSMENHLAALMEYDKAYELDRVRRIREWVQASGGIEQALDASPVLAVLKDGSLGLTDGYHRIGIAFFDHGARTVRTLCCDIDEALRLRERSNPGPKA